MTTTPLSIRTPARPRSGTHPLTGLATLLRFMLHRDRIRTTAWVLGLGGTGYILATALQNVYATQQDIAGIGLLLQDPVTRMMMGPGFGLDELSHQVLFAAAYALFIYIVIALFSIFTVVRHTRGEEESGRSELIRANVVGRHTSLTAALIFTTLAQLVIALLILAGLLASGFDAPGSLLVAAGGLAVGLVFAGVAATTAQLSESAGGSSAMAGTVLGASYLIRMLGDMPSPGGSALSWFSPLAWSQQTAPFVLDRWWPLAISLAFTLALVWAGFHLSTRRDVGASLFATRLGRGRARPTLGTALGVAARTLRGGLLGWGLALGITGLVSGGFAQAMIEAGNNIPAEWALILPGDNLLTGYFAYMAFFIAVLAAAAGVNALRRLTVEENRGRAEYLLSAPVSRISWFISHLLVTVVGVALILLLAGLGTSLGTLFSLGEGAASISGS